MSALVREVRIQLRQLRKSPGFSMAVVLSLALGIGATTAVFSLVEGVLLRPLPFRDAVRLVELGDHLGSHTATSVTAREIATYANATSAFSSMGGYLDSSYELSGGETPEQVNGTRVTAGLLPTLGVQPLLGRVFTAEEEAAHQPLAVIGYSLWLRRFHLDPHVLGSVIVLDRRAYTVLGVMPRSFEFPVHAGHLEGSQLWVPLSLGADELSEEHAGFWGYHMVARLKPGVTFEQAAQDVDRVAKQIMRAFPPSQAALHIRGDATPLREDVAAETRPLLRTMFLAVGVVLLIACVNVAGLLLVRAIRRRRDYAVRLALGARASAIVRESVCEGLLLSTAGGLLGLAFAATVIRTTLHLLPGTMPRIDSIRMDGTVAVFALLLALATGVLCGLVPAFAALRTNLIESLKEGAQTGTGAASHTWLRSSLVVAEIAIALVLLTTSGAFLRSLQKMRAVDPGFHADHVLVAKYQLPLHQYTTNDAAERFSRAVLDRLSGKPGVVSAATTQFLPATDFAGESAFTIEGVPVSSWKLQFAAFGLIDGDYFHAMGIPLLAGRAFTQDDRADTPAVVIVNETMARHAWPGQNAIGKRMHVGNPKKPYPWATVVGIVADTKLGARDEASIDQWYAPVQQPATLYGPGDAAGRLTEAASGYVVLRSALAPEQMAQTLRASVAEVDPHLALQQVQPMGDVLSAIEAPRLFNTELITAFAMGALLLAMTGTYAVVAFSVSLRGQEVAVRMALGAQRGNIARLVLLSGMKLALLGCALGLLGSVAVSRVVGSFLFGVSAIDPWVYTAASLAMLWMAVLASALPALRAASVDPVRALRAG